MFKQHLIFIGGVLFLALNMVMCSGCDAKKGQVAMTDKEIQESMIENNKGKTKREAVEIAEFIKLKGWKMKETGTGLQYQIYEQGNGDSVSKTGQDATVHYSIYLLNDSMCYSSRDSDPATFKIGLSGVESGLHEGLTYMKEGDKAKFIVPSHLAYGTFGDGDKIPPQTPLVYDIELIRLN